MRRSLFRDEGRSFLLNRFLDRSVVSCNQSYAPRGCAMRRRSTVCSWNVRRRACCCRVRCRTCTARSGISAFWKPAAGNSSAARRWRCSGEGTWRRGAAIWENLAEVRSLAIAKPWRGNGFGNILVDECCKDARRIGIDRVFALTYQVRFFERNGFGVVSKDLLPQRVWIVCANCPRFPDCDEVAVMRHLDAGGA